MNSPEYHVAVTIELHRVGGGWEEHELQKPVQKRCVGFTIPKGQLTNFASVAQTAANVVSMGVQDASVKEAIDVGLLQQRSQSGLTA